MQQEKKKIMVTLTFLIIAFLIRKRFLQANASTFDKVCYYSISVCLTPLIGPWLYKMIAESKPTLENKHNTIIGSDYCL